MSTTFDERERERERLDKHDRRNFPLWRPTDPTQKAEVFGYNSPAVRREMGMVLRDAGVASSASLGPAIDQDILPELFEVFVRDFRLMELLPKREANGIADEFRRWIAYSQRTPDEPVTMGESDQVQGDANTYVNDTCHIAQFGTLRGAPLRAIFGARASGSPDVMNDEVDGGLLRIGHDFQTEAFRMQSVGATVAGQTAGANTPLGVYDANGFRGFRFTTEFLSPSANVETIDVRTSGVATPWDPNAGIVTDAFASICDTITGAGGKADSLMAAGTAAARSYFRKEVQAKSRGLYSPDGMLQVSPGAYVPSITLGDGERVPYYRITPDECVGQYAISGQGIYVDIYIWDTRFTPIVWLGSPGPAMLELPMGGDRTLRNLKIPFWFASLEFAVPMFVGKLRLRIG
jgi:hypothetical protein